MSKTVELISPIDGSTYLTREVLSRDAAFAAAQRARRAQPGWAARPLEERVALVRRANEVVGQSTDRMAVELAHQMGRPVRRRVRAACGRSGIPRNPTAPRTRPDAC